MSLGARTAWEEVTAGDDVHGDDGHGDVATGDAERDELVRRLVEMREDRELGGALALHPGELGPWREAPRVGVQRSVVAGVVLAAGGVLAAWVATSSLAALALLALVATGYVIAAVDHDTLYLDIWSWWAGVAGVWAVLALDRFLDGDLRRVWWAAVAGGVWWASLELMNVAYRVLRKTDGLGGGDGMIAFSTVGVTYVVTGSAYAALWAVLAGLLAAMVVSIPMMLLRRRGMRSAFALGPFLALGWQLALVAWELGWIVL
jgi:prepilin signal peptidase PulO-like enzyme (type II secretory pathway)